MLILLNSLWNEDMIFFNAKKVGCLYKKAYFLLKKDNEIIACLEGWKILTSANTSIKYENLDSTF